MNFSLRVLLASLALSLPLITGGLPSVDANEDDDAQKAKLTTPVVRSYAQTGTPAPRTAPGTKNATTAAAAKIPANANTAKTATTASTTKSSSAAAASKTGASDAKPSAGAAKSAAAQKSPVDAAAGSYLESTGSAAGTDNSAVVRSSQLANSVKAYRAQPDPAKWEVVLKDVCALLSSTAKLPAASLIKENASLVELGSQVHDAGGARVWTFVKVPESQTAIVQWQNFAPGPEAVVRVRGRKRVVRGAPIVSWKMQALHLPGGIVVQESKLVSAPSTIVSVGKKAVRTDYTRSLILAGVEKTGNTWLHGYRLADGNWVEAADLFGGVPPYLLQNLAGKVSFSGNDLILSVGSQGAPTTASSGYRIVLRLVSGKYCLEGKSGAEGPIAVVEQFAQALQQNRFDLAKGWLADAKLMSIPKYVGITGHSTAQPLRIIPMASPGNGNSRFRLMTFSKDDLIVDVGKDRKTQQLAIKSIFIAPPDPVAQKLLGNLSVPVVSDQKAGGENVGK